ncbi:MAG: UDP-N-acetylglucosamine 2-epimerase, partial [Microbacterium sp.]
TVVVGDVMTDVLTSVRDRVADDPLPDGVAGGGYYVATIHRPDNTDDPAHLRGIVDGLAGLDKPVLLLAHPRLVHTAERMGVELARGAVQVREPLAYPQLVRAVMGAAGVVTDSGGLQKEAFLLRTPATTVRPETEWVETVDLGWNLLVAPEAEAITAAVGRPAPADTDEAPYGDGNAASRVVDELLQRALITRS